MRKVTYTHKGWLGVCPVYIAKPETQGPDVIERHWLFAPLMWLTLCLYEICFAQQQLVNPFTEAAWPIKITGDLRTPIAREAVEDEGQ